ncbi:MAG TPA: CheR family methyltransferase [Stellaceae bacterium]|jgi:two-component system CheB/CheR fusion protein|nr:CheR family methyltransferase [Stellaceae bacterium]
MPGTQDFPIVGVGASAGGVEALEGFFRGLPAEPGIALVLVTHLSPNRESLLHEIVARYTRLPVHVAVHDMPVAVDHVYVLPADAALGIEGRRLQLRRNGSRNERKPIDLFFSTLAVDIGERAAGIVLSGGDGDGTLGIKAIKERGGLTLAQIGDRFGPQHPDMPESAISTGLIDFAIPVESMGSKLVEFARGAPLLDGLADDPTQLDDDQSIDQVVPEIYAILRSRIGHDFSGYKTRTFMRRLQRRMQVNQLDTLEGYAERLRQEPQEVSALFRDLLINVTTFFRDDAAFESLAREVVPKLFEGRGADETVRVWVPGCATGEEVFSIAILLREHIDKINAVPRVQVFATDIDERALSVARGARYPAPLLESVSPERRKRFFVADGGSFVVSTEIRELCVFSPHSVIRDPPFSRMDLVSCRNLLIYFGADIQNQVIPTFHYALRPDGYLFLGSAENVTHFEDLFIPIDKRQRIFRRRSDVRAIAPRLPSLDRVMTGQPMELLPRRGPVSGVGLRNAVDSQVLDRFSPPHVLVNRDGDIVYYSSRTGKYFEAPAGLPTRQLLTLARRGLRLDLRSLFREAVETGGTVSRRGIAVETDNAAVQLVNLTIEPLRYRGHGEPLYVVVFTDDGSALSADEASDRIRTTQVASGVDFDQELRETRDRLQSMIEEYETALEELKSSNEELVSVNEEMQSTNEELEASKEELQSVNEELYTVNAELNIKVEELDRANSDLQNLFATTDIALVFLDKELVIRSFTPAVEKIFRVLPGDRGRPITDLASKLNLPGFADDIAKVFSGNGPIERQVENDDRSEQYLVRLTAYSNGDHQIDGVVATFVDVSSLTRAEARQRVLIAELEHRTRNLLAVVQALARKTLGEGRPLADFMSRLEALGRTQSVTGLADRRIDLGDLVRLQLEALGALAENKVSLSGPPVPLTFDLIQTFGLALHELATNAVKYGALKEEPGRLAVNWAVRREPSNTALLVLDWVESGVTDMPAQPGSGFGRQLIEEALVFTHRASTKVSFNSDGIVCHIQMPLPQARTTDHP